MNHYKFTESSDGTGTLKKEVKHEGQPSEWVDDLKTPIPFFGIATKDFVRDLVRQADPDFKGTYTSMDDIEAISPVDANDWAYLQTLDEKGNDVYSRYRYTVDNGWTFEVAIKRDNFTDEEWAAITSGITTELVEYKDVYLSVAATSANITDVSNHHDGIDRGRPVTMSNADGYVWLVLPASYSPVVVMGVFRVPMTLDGTTAIDGKQYGIWKSNSEYEGTFDLYLF